MSNEVTVVETVKEKKPFEPFMPYLNFTNMVNMTEVGVKNVSTRKMEKYGSDVEYKTRGIFRINISIFTAETTTILIKLLQNKFNGSKDVEVLLTSKRSNGLIKEKEIDFIDLSFIVSERTEDILNDLFAEMEKFVKDHELSEIMFEQREPFFRVYYKILKTVKLRKNNIFYTGISIVQDSRNGNPDFITRNKLAMDFVYQEAFSPLAFPTEAGTILTSRERRNALITKVLPNARISINRDEQNEEYTFSRAYYLSHDKDEVFEINAVFDDLNVSPDGEFVDMSSNSLVVILRLVNHSDPYNDKNNSLRKFVFFGKPVEYHVFNSMDIGQKQMTGYRAKNFLKVYDTLQYPQKYINRLLKDDFMTLMNLYLNFADDVSLEVKQFETAEVELELDKDTSTSAPDTFDIGDEPVVEEPKKKGRGKGKSKAKTEVAIEEVETVVNENEMVEEGEIPTETIVENDVTNNVEQSVTENEENKEA